MSFWSKKIDGIIALIAGLAILLFPFKVFTGLSLIVGVLLVIAGFRRLYEKIKNKSWRIVNSLLMIAIGVVLLLPNSIILDRDALGYLLGGMLIYNGVVRTIRYRRHQTPMNQSLAGAGIVAVVLGIIVALVPEIIVLTFTIIIGLILVAYGAVRLFVKFNFGGKMSNRFQEFKKEMNRDLHQDVVDVDAEDFTDDFEQ